MRNRRLIQSATLVAALAVACLGAGVATARADQITLDVSGSLTPVLFPRCASSGCTISGTLVINNTTGTFFSADVTMSGESPAAGPFTHLLSISPLGSLTTMTIEGSSADLELSFLTPTPGSLAGYDGGTLSTLSSVLIPAKLDVWALTSGSLTPDTPTATPEPSTWILLAVDLLGLVALLLFGERFGLRRVLDLG